MKPAQDTVNRPPARRRFRRLTAFAALAVLLSVLALHIPVLWAECVSTSAYAPAKDANRYLCLPYAGANFRAYSLTGHSIGRCYLLGKAAAAVVAAYADLEKSLPGRVFLYGETGKEGGAPFWPHRTHQKGLSADFMTPVFTVDEEGTRLPATLPCSPFNLWGYGIRLDHDGRFSKYRLDTGAMIAHLAALRDAAPRYGLRVERVIFDPPLLKLLRADPAFAKIRGMRFMAQKAWFPHDGHYHVDFTEAGKAGP